ncbi:MAG: hypothetical protein ISS47_06040 [Candidatus Omnitrophica bacterium]|nr:hypothetical protein [Candidatus Omnitrophota bacterium]
MIDNNKIKAVSEEKADELYNSLIFCHYCETPFKECDTIVPGKGVVLGEIDVVQYKSRFWHYGCVFDYEKIQ